MILATLLGFALERFAGLANALPVALLLGMFAALLVPTKAACSVQKRGTGPTAEPPAR
ncbi:MAG: hypothetical protein JNK49_03895 [Planctomycetes bacterium]|nr:hypothetical protein [Planctomycetota bacterium]